MNPSPVALVSCRSYRSEEVQAAVDRGLALLGGAAAFVRPGETLLLKPNLLVASPPDAAVTTHPSVFRAVARALAAAGASLRFGDSPAVGSARRAARTAGLTAEADALGVPFADFDDVEPAAAPGHRGEPFPLAGAVTRAPGVISLPKLKTHGLMRFTGAVKNQFGCIPGLRKSAYHLRRPQPHDFARLLADVTAAVRPRLYVMDAVVAMEGPGPRAGRPFPLGALLLSADPVALDATALRLVDIPHGVVPTLAAGEEAGIGRAGPPDLRGDRLEDLRRPDFDAVRRPPEALLRGGRMVRFLRDRLAARPRVHAPSCRRCGLCEEVCPARPKAAVLPPDGPARVDLRRCIRCFCCHEVCPHGALSVSQPLLGRMLRPFRR